MTARAVGQTAVIVVPWLTDDACSAGLQVCWGAGLQACRIDSTWVTDSVRAEVASLQPFPKEVPLQIDTIGFPENLAKSIN